MTTETTSATLPETILNDFRKAVGKEHVLSSPADLALYTYDAAIDRGAPRAAVFPATAQEIAAVVKICRKNNIPFVARGAGTNLTGSAIPLHGAVVIAPTRMKRILSIDPQKRTAVVEPGIPNLFLKKALEPHGLHYAPDPASQKACTIGGNIGTNAGGPHCLKYGVTSQHVLALQIVLPDGEIAEFDLAQDGPDLTGLFVGSEGTLGIVTRATLNLLPIPAKVETMLVSFPSLESAMQTVTGIISAGIIPATLEAMDKITVQAVEAFTHAGYPIDAEAVLLIEVDGSTDLRGQVEEIKKICAQNGSKEFRLAQNAAEREKLWEGRRGSYPAMARLAPNVLVEDGVVPRNRLAEASRKMRAIAHDNNLSLSLIFHAGDGNLHPQILFDERDPEKTKLVKSAGFQMLMVCVELGGSISGEHGIGTDKREAMRWLFTRDTLIFFRKVKSAFDPENLCNPDKLIPLAEKNGNGAPAHPTAQAPAAPGDKIIEHDVENFTVTVEAGLKVEALQQFLKAKKQKALLVGNDTLGGLLNANPAQEPRLRDQILGMNVILADGTVAQLGGKVVKNVAGYDAAKLFLGARGTLGVILSVTLRTFPESYPVQPTAMAQTSVSIPPVTIQILHKLKAALDPKGLFPSL